MLGAIYWRSRSWTRSSYPIKLVRRPISAGTTRRIGPQRLRDAADHCRHASPPRGGQPLPVAKIPKRTPEKPPGQPANLGAQAAPVPTLALGMRLSRSADLRSCSREVTRSLERLICVASACRLRLMARNRDQFWTRCSPSPVGGEPVSIAEGHGSRLDSWSTGRRFCLVGGRVICRCGTFVTRRADTHRW